MVPRWPSDDIHGLIQDLTRTDRWQLHSAVELMVSHQASLARSMLHAHVHLQVTLPWADNVSVKLKQEPHALNATRIGVGACLWEGELFLTAYLGACPAPRHHPRPSPSSS